MDTNWIQIIVQAGAVGISLVVLILCFKLGLKFYELVKKLIDELAESRRIHEVYIAENNHTVTDLVRESTTTMVETREAIKKHNEISENQNRVLEILLEKIK